MPPPIGVLPIATPSVPIPDNGGQGFGNRLLRKIGIFPHLTNPRQGTHPLRRLFWRVLREFKEFFIAADPHLTAHLKRTPSPPRPTGRIPACAKEPLVHRFEDRPPSEKP